MDRPIGGLCQHGMKGVIAVQHQVSEKERAKSRATSLQDLPSIFKRSDVPRPSLLPRIMGLPLFSERAGECV